MDEPSFKRFEQKILLSYIMDSLNTDIRTDENKNAFMDSTRQMMELKDTSFYLAAIEEKLFYKQPYISSDGSVKFYGQDLIHNMVQGLIVDKSSSDIFREFVLQKSLLTSQVVCLNRENYFERITDIRKKPILSQMVLEYMDKDAAQAAPNH